MQAFEEEMYNWSKQQVVPLYVTAEAQCAGLSHFSVSKENHSFMSTGGGHSFLRGDAIYSAALSKKGTNRYL